MVIIPIWVYEFLAWLKRRPFDVCLLVSFFSLFFCALHVFDNNCQIFAPFFRCFRISIRGLGRRLVGWSVMLSSKSMKNGPLWIINDLDSAGRGKKREEGEAGTRRKE